MRSFSKLEQGSTFLGMIPGSAVPARIMVTVVITYKIHPMITLAPMYHLVRLVAYRAHYET